MLTTGAAAASIVKGNVIMKRTSMVACGAMALTFLIVGCNSALVGTWKADPIPTGEPFYIRQVQFKDNGEYEASARRGGDDQMLRGKYDFNGLTLKLRSAGKPDRNYPTTLWWGKSLELTVGDKKHTLKKQ